MKIKINYFSLIICVLILSACKSQDATLSESESTTLTNNASISPYAPGAANFSLSVYPKDGPVTPSASATITSGTAAIVRVTVTDSNGKPFSSAISSLNFTMPAGNSTGNIGIITPVSPGIFEAPFTAIRSGAPVTVQAVVNSTTIASTVQITVTTGAPDSLIIVNNDILPTLASTNFAIRPKVKVIDKAGNPVVGAPVVFKPFAIGETYGTTLGVPLNATASSLMSGAASLTVLSDADGYAEATWSASTIPGIAAMSASVGNIKAVFSGLVYDKPSTPTIWLTSITNKISTAWNVDYAGGGNPLLYTVYKSTSPTGPFTVVGADLLTTSFSDLTATSGTFYYYVVASNGYISSEKSRVVNNITTPFNWSLITANASQYTYDNTLVDFNGSGGACQLKPSAQVDSSTELSLGTSVGTAVMGTYSALLGDTLRLANAGGCDATTTNCSELDATWTPKWSNLIGYWKLNSSTTASAGSTAATLGGNATYTSTTKLGSKAVTFDGSGDSISVGNVAPTGTQSFTVSLWMKTSVTPTLNGAFLFYRNFSDGSRIWILLNTSGILRVNSYFPSSFCGAGGTAGACDYWGTTTKVVNDNLWHHIVYSFNRTGSAVAYVDGVASYTANASASSVTNWGTGNTSYFGASYSTGAYNDFNGLIDEPAIWNTALSAAEVATIYNRQSAAKAGTFTSRVMDAFSSTANWTQFSWTTTSPFFKELPDQTGSAQNERTTDYPWLRGSTNSGGDDNTMSSIAGLWHFNEAAGTTGSGSVKDTSGTNKNGTPGTGVTLGSIGKFGTAATFNGTSNGNIILSNTTTAADVSFSAWIYPTGSDLENIIGGSGIFQYVSTNAGDYRVYDNTGWKIAGPAPLNKWTHVGLTFKGSGALGSTRVLTLYINGVSVYTNNTSTYTNGSITNIGAYTSGAQRFFLGSIDEVAIWSRVLIPEEMLMLYRRGANRIKFQVRTCTAANCTDDAAGANWKGPDGTNGTYFSEAYNKSTQSITPSGSVLKAPPSMSFASFTNPAPTNRYFQYRSILESDDLGTSCSYGSGATWCSPELKEVKVDPIHYARTATVVTDQALNAFTILKMAETLSPACSGGIKYAMSNDKVNWFYWNGSQWAVSDGTAAQANTLTTLQGDGILPTVGPVQNYNHYLKIFLQSDGTTPCSINNVKFDYQ